MIIKDKLRWVLCIPSAFFALVFVYGVARLLKPFIAEHPILRTVFFQVTMGCSASFISAFLFVGMGAMVAPAHQTNVAKILALTFTLLSVLKINDLIWGNSSAFDVPWIYIILATMSGVGGAVGMFFLLNSKDNQNH